MTISCGTEPARSPRASRSATIRRSGLVPVEAVVGRAGAGDRGVVGEDRDRRQAVALADRVVVVVVGRRDLERAGPERRLDDLVRDDRHVALDERDPHPAADEGRVARVVRVDRDRGVAEDRLGAGRGDGDRRVGVGLRRSPRRSGGSGWTRASRSPGVGDHLEVADARPAARAPVDERLGAVGQPVPVEPVEGDADGLRRALVHRVAQPAPVDRRRRPVAAGRA